MSFELRDTETGAVVSDPAIAHGPVYDPLDMYLSYVISADRRNLQRDTKFVLVDTVSDSLLVHGTIQRLPDVDESKRVWRLLLPTNLVPDPRLAGSLVVV